MTNLVSPAPGLAGYIADPPPPFDDNDRIDLTALAQLCERQIEAGASAIVVGETAGEASTLTPAEHDAIVHTAIEIARGRARIIAGAGSNSTAQPIDWTRRGEMAAADAVLSVVPYYNKPMQAGIYAHFSVIADAVGLPVFLYDVPARTVCGLADDTVARLAECPKFIGLKDATGDITRPLRLRSRVGPEFRLLSGDDATAAAFIGQGGNGCISVTSNVAPGLCRAMYLALKQGQLSRTQHLAAVVARLTSALFSESNPVPVKYALSTMKMMSPGVRLDRKST